MDKFRQYLVTIYVAVQGSASVIGTLIKEKGIADDILGQTIPADRMPLIVGGLILAITLVILILIKYGLSSLFYWFTEYVLLAVVTALLLFFLGAPPFSIVLFAGMMLILRYLFKFFRHVGTMAFAVGATAVLGSYLEVKYVVAIFLFLFLMDILSSRVTRHMQTIAEDASEKGGSLTFTFKTPGGTFIIGSADIVFPSMLVVSAFIYHGAPEAVFSSIFALAGLLLASRRKEAHAIPYASLGIAGFIIGYLLSSTAIYG